MRRGGSAVRPVGTDGSDFSYRMTVDDKYRRAAHARMHLRRFVAIQTAFVLFKALWSTLMTLNGEPLEMTTVCACIFGGASVLVGTLALKTGASPHLLKLYLLLTGTSISLSLLPIISGRFFAEQWSDEWQKSSKENRNKVILVSLEAVQEAIGILVQLLSVSKALSLSNSIARKK
ncbi:uncharacterized protein LOC112341838 isoform X1 [Selaginella moellendorffii]|uniref:uncharacterized protein LOC112341838 isoform X1 n=1 Tax=Selaginella moellendorffii TaxID=88036 RepID=UPI000D1C5982|nr:uncharacterized protein LOC112341838 isoform X1 [Selaginella moellendorffii]|eukprot:XP_024518422.1 uncharacterized protein LOC112341838 isoform X1 [Selaginella moellendorffii]